MDNNNFFQVYEQILHYENIQQDGMKKEVHGARIKREKRSCIFCGKAFPEVSFSKVAHAISESIGNKTLISHFECDSCNVKFGSTFEDSFGKYISPYKFVSQIFGKKNSITNKGLNNSYRLELKKNAAILPDISKTINSIIIDSQQAEIVTLGEKGFVIKLPRQSYNPRYVYCALLKMAYSIIPLSEIDNFIKGAIALRFVLGDATDSGSILERENILDRLPYIGAFEFVPGIDPFAGISVTLFRRKPVSENKYPYFLFKVNFKNFSLQIPVLSDKDTSPDMVFRFKPLVSFENSNIRILDFKKPEDYFICEFSAHKIDIPKENYIDIENALRNKGWL